MAENDYFSKYLKYKQKYIELKNLLLGGVPKNSTGSEVPKSPTESEIPKSMPGEAERKPPKGGISKYTSLMLIPYIKKQIEAKNRIDTIIQKFGIFLSLVKHQDYYLDELKQKITFALANKLFRKDVLSIEITSPDREIMQELNKALEYALKLEDLLNEVKYYFTALSEVPPPGLFTEAELTPPAALSPQALPVGSFGAAAAAAADDATPFVFVPHLKSGETTRQAADFSEVDKNKKIFESFLNAILGPKNLVCVLCTKTEETGKQLYYNIFSRTTPPANRICMPRPNPLQLWHLTFHGWGTNREPGIHGKIHLKDDTEKLTFNFVNVGGRIACTVYGSNEKLIKDIKARPYYSGIRSFLLLFIKFFSIPLVSNIIFPILEPRGDSDEVTFV